MITNEKIEEWIREAEERPDSAAIIIRFIGNRLNELEKWNEELQSENLSLRTEKKVEDFESRIGILEYQLGLLKRQLGGEIILPEDYNRSEFLPDTQILSLLIYHTQGQVLRLEMPLAELASGNISERIPDNTELANLPLQILPVYQNEELLFVFDSGRTISVPVASIPASDKHNLNWEGAFLQPPLGSEELSFIYPVGRMGLFDYCVQISRKGCVKKIKEALFETYLAKSYIGTGIKSQPDKTCGLVFCKKNERLNLVSKEGILQCIEVESLPATIEEVIRLSITDHIITAFTSGVDNPGKSCLLFITSNGKVIQRDLDWLEVASSYKSKGQAVYSQERRQAGIRLVSAEVVNEVDWGIALCSDGELVTYEIKEIIEAGTLLNNAPGKSIIDFAILPNRESL